LVPTFVVVGVLAYLVTRLSYASMPPLPLLAGITLLVLAALEAILGYYLKARIERKPGTEPVEPLVAARAVALAKASAVAGTVVAGAWAGILGYLLPQRDQLAAAVDDTPSAVVGLISAAALVAAALWLQHCCRTPLDSDDEQRPRQR
jgi:uncharacterized membrane protein